MQKLKPWRKLTVFNKKALTKGELRKLAALRRALGDDIADRAFAEWLEIQSKKEQDTIDPNAGLIAETLYKLVASNKLTIPKQGYLVKRGRGRVIVTVNPRPEPETAE